MSITYSAGFPHAPTSQVISHAARLKMSKYVLCANVQEPDLLQKMAKVPLDFLCTCKLITRTSASEFLGRFRTRRFHSEFKGKLARINLVLFENSIDSLCFLFAQRVSGTVCKRLAVVRGICVHGDSRLDFQQDMLQKSASDTESNKSAYDAKE